jgi:plasmid stabilization system protein ParE
MKLVWTSKAASDLGRLYEFLAAVNAPAAASVVQGITRTVAQLANHPQLGQGLEAFKPRDIRQLMVGQYELRYEVSEQTVMVLRIWHCREAR